MTLESRKSWPISFHTPRMSHSIHSFASSHWEVKKWGGFRGCDLIRTILSPTATFQQRKRMQFSNCCSVIGSLHFWPCPGIVRCRQSRLGGRPGHTNALPPRPVPPLGAAEGALRPALRCTQPSLQRSAVPGSPRSPAEPTWAVSDVGEETGSLTQH